MFTPTTPLQAKLRAAIAAITGHRPQDLAPEQFLESDLGIDSIKMVELSQSLMQLVPEARREQFTASVAPEQLIRVQTVRELEAIFEAWDIAPAPTSTPTPEPAPFAAIACDAAPSTADTRAAAPASCATVFALVAKITGHRPQDLDLAMYLESDLGIDSIKMVELTQGLLTLRPGATADALGADDAADQLMQVMQLQTLGDIVRWFDGGHAADAEASEPEATEPEDTEQPVAVKTLPVLPSQYIFLVGHWAVSTCGLATRVRLQGPFDMALARSCWGDLLARHPALRSHFVIPPDATSFTDYRYEAPTRVSTPELALTDLSAFGADQQEAMVVAEVERCVNHTWTLQEPLLHRFFVLRLGADLHEVFFTNHHLISDGMSNQQVMREFLALYGAGSGDPLPALAPPTSDERYCEVVTAIDASRDAGEDQVLAELLRRQGRQSFAWHPDGAPRATERAYVKNHRLRLDLASSQALVALTGTLRVSLNSLLVSAYLRTIDGYGRAGDGPIFFNIPTSGRVYPGLDASGIIGCFAQNLALDFARPASDESWPALVQRVHANIYGAISQGCDRAQTRQTTVSIRDRMRLENGRIPASHCALIRAGMKSNLYLPYIGNTRLGERCGPLRVLDYQAGTITNAGTMDTVIEMFHGALEMTVNYDANHFEAMLVAQLGEAFLAALRSLAAVQVQVQVQVQVPTDAPRAVSSTSHQQDWVRQVAAEVMHRPVSVADMGLDLEADLGLDSLERIRIVSRLLQAAGGADGQRLLACRRLDDMAVALSGTAAAAAEALPDLPDLPCLRIAAQCARTPQAVAVWTEEGALTYGELHRQSNQLAHCLRAQGLGRGSLVGLMLQRGPRVLVALLGILKAGAAYVPLDPDYPKARLRYMIAHSRIGSLLTEAAVDEALTACLDDPETLPLRHLVYLDEAPAHARPLPGFERIGRGVWSGEPTHDLDPVAGPDDPMVVFYTSGSSGQPKGVLLAHGGYANRLDWHQRFFKLQPGERVAWKTSVSFDISVGELLWPLQHGGTICPVPAATLRDPWALAQWMRRTEVRVMHFVPSLFGEFVAAVEGQPIAFPALRQLLFSGEALPAPLVRRWFARFGTGTALANLYGPTEASIDVSAWLMTQAPDDRLARIPIGHASPGVHLLVLDENMHRLPVGEQGELWIGGVQLAQGYLHDPKRSAEAFRANPHADVPCPTLYRTGDLCVQLADGSFDYRGRCDSQVKIRGYRVELGEIETVLSAHPAVREAAVLALDPGDGHLRLAAWLSGHGAGATSRVPDTRALREFLGQRLPAYMVPASFEWLPNLPKNQNGKLDRKALAQGKHVAQPVTAPSLAFPGAVQSPAPAPFATEPSAAPAHLATVQSPSPNAPGQRVDAVMLDFPLAPAQHWLLAYFDAPYQWAGFSRFRYLQPLDIGLFNRALQRMTRRYAALRSVFRQRDGVWRQSFPEPRQWPQAEVYDGTDLAPAARDEHLRALICERVAGLRLDGDGPLWHVIVIKQAQACYDICVVGHHMISDMLGSGTLFKALWQVYDDCLAGSDLDGRGADPAESPSFTAYLGALDKFRQPEHVARSVDYWTQRFPAGEPPFSVPLDHRLGENIEASEAVEEFSLTAQETASLQRSRSRHGCSLYALLLAPVYRAMAEWSGRSKVTLSQRSHGRDLGDGTHWFECIGNFAVNFPLAVQVEPQADWGTLVQAIKREFEQVPLNGVSYDLAADHLPARLYPDHKLTPVRVNYLGYRSPPQSKLFAFDDADRDQRYALPTLERSTLIEAIFVAIDGAMQLKLSYSSHFHEAGTIRRLGERVMALMRDLLALPARAELSAPCLATSLASSLATFSATSQAPTAAVTASRHAPPLWPTGADTPAAARPAASSATTPGPFAGKVAVVTGAGRGIGRRVAVRLAQQGARLVLVSRSAAPLAEALAEVKSHTAEAIAVTADVTSLAEVEAMTRQAAARFGGVDILINNAGANRASLLAESEPAEWRAIVDLNLMSAYYCCRSAVPLMVARGGGKIVNLGSAASVIGYPLFSAYSASKHAVVGLTKALAEEVKQSNVQVNVVCPAFVDTRMTPQAMRGVAMSTDQVADLVLFLASPQSAGVTGESINIFGRQDMYAYGSDKMKTVQAMTRDFSPGLAA